MDFARSGVVAFGKYESGHSSQSGMIWISLMSVELERSCGWAANVFCSQIDTQAINAHK